jgi:hypothetical protein
MSVVPLVRKGNRHPADELADVRAGLKRLQEREGELRALLLAKNADLVGDEYSAEIRSWMPRQFRYEYIVGVVGEEMADKCCPKVNRVAVWLHERSL